MSIEGEIAGFKRPEENEAKNILFCFLFERMIIEMNDGGE